MRVHVCGGRLVYRKKKSMIYRRRSPRRHHALSLAGRPRCPHLPPLPDCPTARVAADAARVAAARSLRRPRRLGRSDGNCRIYAASAGGGARDTLVACFLFTCACRLASCSTCRVYRRGTSVHFPSHTTSLLFLLFSARAGRRRRLRRRREVRRRPRLTLTVGALILPTRSVEAFRTRKTDSVPRDREMTTVYSCTRRESPRSCTCSALDRRMPGRACKERGARQILLTPATAPYGLR